MEKRIVDKIKDLKKGEIDEKLTISWDFSIKE